MKFFFIGVAIGAALLLLFFTLSQAFKADQPIAFNHKVHLDQGVECDTCHQFYKTQSFSGLPHIDTCLECHKEPMTKSPEEEKIRIFAKQGKDLAWKQIHVEPEHVFFSHRRHVVLGKLACQGCHGTIGQSERPPSAPAVKMTMSWCMGCHARSKVTNDCMACHV